MNSVLNLILVALTLSISVPCFSSESTPDFAVFDQRAKSGERLNVVFFGASLTWGANASDPQQTSYRALVAQRLEASYPQAHFKFRDAAIGGTGSQLGVFRFERDVLRHKPDLVFLDFSANDDIYSDNVETLASYESLVRRIILDAKCPCVQVIFPFMWNVQNANVQEMKRRDAHLAIAKAYNCPVGDAIDLGIKRVASGETTLQKLWPFDGVHPGDGGYVLFADAAWTAFQQGVNEKRVCAAPEKMLYSPTYMKCARVKISSLGEPQAGWRVTVPNPVSSYFDMLMSRWLDDEVVASNRKEVVENGKKSSVPQEVSRLKVKFNGSMVMLFGESTKTSGKYHVYVDGKLVENHPDKKKPPQQEFDAGNLGRILNGNTHLAQVLITGLDASVNHTLEIEPVFDAANAQELRLESICVAGGQAKVSRE